MKKQIKKIKSLPLTICCFIILSCLGFWAPNSRGSEAEEMGASISSGTLALLPFVKGDYTEQFRTKSLSPLLCPINQVCMDLNEGDETLAFMKDLDSMLYRMVKKKLAARLLPMEETETQYNMIPIDAAKDTPLSTALTLAEKIRADYVLVPILWDYAQRVGNPIAATKPASVSFSLYLVSAEEGEMVWRDSFAETQQALSENILEAKEVFKFGGKWVTAEELSQAGLHEILENFPLGATAQ
jgi:hypothetical protein